MRLLYTIGIFFYRIAIAIAALFQKKARLWQQGRKGEFARLSAAFAGQPRPVWVHSASLGEYEQARPLIERIKKERPDVKVLATFSAMCAAFWTSLTRRPRLLSNMSIGTIIL